MFYDRDGVSIYHGDALTPWAKFRGQARLAEIVLTHGGDHGD